MTVLSDLLTKLDQTAILNGEVIPELQRNGIRTTDWSPLSVERADAYTAAAIGANSREQISVLAATRFGDYVFGFVPLPAGFSAEEQADLLAWAPIIAKQAYGIDQIDATFTLRNITLTNSGATAFNKPAGSIIIVFPSGDRYVNAAAYVSAGNDVVVVSFRSEFAHDSANGRNYADVSGVSGIQIVTANLPGVAATNPAPTFSPSSGVAVQVGSGLGKITGTGSPAGFHSIVITILSSGLVGSATWSYVVDGGAATTGTVGVVANAGGTGITLTPADNGGSPSFIAGATYYLSCPGSDVTQAGRDVEAPQALGTRCRALYPLLSFPKDSAGNALPLSPTQLAYQALVLTAFTQVYTCLVQTSSTVNDAINIYIAGQGALLDTGVIAAVQAFLNSFNMLTDKPTVASPAAQPILLAGATVTVKSAQAVAAKAEAQRRVSVYLKGVDPVMSLPYGGLIDRSYILSLIRSTPGVTHLDDALTLQGSGGPAAADYQLASATMATYAIDIGTALTWSTI